MSRKQINILLVPSDLAGVGHYRSIWPGQEINRKHPEDFRVEIDHMPDFGNIEFFKQFDIIHFHRQLGPYDRQESFIKELRESGVIVIMDLDDYWMPPKEHPMYGAAMQEKLPEKITSTFRMVDYVTTTTGIFANHISKYNSNVHVVPNAIDMTHPMWKSEDTRVGDRVRVSWIGGSSHMKDLELLKSSMNILHNDESLKGKYQIVMCGYDVRGFITEVDQKGNVIQNRKIHPHETIWNKFEEVFTDNYNPNLIPEGYRNHLLKYENTTFKDFDVYGSGYVRRWTLPLTQYGKHYNYCDVCLAPLAENTFNEVKSELKIIEAGLTKKVLIAQEFGIYKELIENGKNGILIPKNKNLRGWYEAIKKVVNDKDYREELSNNLYDFVRQKYTLEIVTEKRTEWYREILENRKSVHLLEGVATHSI
jgi:glycosyltransferase involved in cell wall biosynthesis